MSKILTDQGFVEVGGELYHHGILGMKWGHRKQRINKGNRPRRKNARPSSSQRFSNSMERRRRVYGTGGMGIIRNHLVSTGRQILLGFGSAAVQTAINHSSILNGKTLIGKKTGNHYPVSFVLNKGISAATKAAAAGIQANTAVNDIAILTAGKHKKRR